MYPAYLMPPHTLLFLLHWAFYVSLIPCLLHRHTPLSIPPPSPPHTPSLRHSCSSGWTQGRKRLRLGWKSAIRCIRIYLPHAMLVLQVKPEVSWYSPRKPPDSLKEKLIMKIQTICRVGVIINTETLWRRTQDNLTPAIMRVKWVDLFKFVCILCWSSYGQNWSKGKLHP
jgi:hypothetical protein